MKKWRMREIWRSPVFWLVIIIIAQTVVYGLAGASKAYLHMDEIYSYGLSNHERVQIYETEGFYDTWHEGKYYDEYLTVSEDERGDFAPVYQNQRDDVHPPLFYALLRIGMEIMGGEFTKWTGIVLNMLIAGVSTAVIWMMVRELMGERKQEVKALVLTAMVALGLATTSTVVYIRMYELLTLWVVLTTWLHLKLLRKNEGQNKRGLLIAIGAVELAGALTQYYFWFYMAAMFMVFAIRYIVKKDWKMLAMYAGTVMGAGVVSLVIWPYSYQHMFQGYRGQGVMETLRQPLVLMNNLWEYMQVLDTYVFHKLMLIIGAVMIILCGGVILGRKRLRVREGQSERIAVVFAPMLFYLVIVAAASPFIALRYVAPVCGLLLILVMWSLWGLCEGTWGKKWGNVAMGVMVIGFGIMPLVAGLEPDVVYRERGEWVAEAQARSGVPALYLMKTGDDWGFLNDILLVREFDESYVAKDIGEDVNELKKVLEAKDLTDGLVVFINDGQDVDEVIGNVKEATGLEEVIETRRLVMSDVYYLK